MPQSDRDRVLRAVSGYRRRVESTDHGADRLNGLCRLLAVELGVRACALELSTGARSGWSEPTAPGAPGRRPVAGAGETFRWLPVTMGGDRLASLGLRAGRRQWRSLTRSGLLADVADALAPVVAVTLLEGATTTQLTRARSYAERIAAARRQAFAERDDERRELERDLHDGAQHHLVALRLTLALIEVHVGAADLQAAAADVAQLRDRVDQAEKVLLNTAAGVSPPVLLELGLVEALAAEFQDAGHDVRLVASATMKSRRFPFVVETAVYFTCLEAVNNVHKHAPSARVTVSLNDTARGLSFDVSDDGPGLPDDDAMTSFGMDNMKARTEAAGGRLVVRSGDVGTTVEGFIPI